METLTFNHAIYYHNFYKAWPRYACVRENIYAMIVTAQAHIRYYFEITVSVKASPFITVTS